MKDGSASVLVTVSLAQIEDIDLSCYLTSLHVSCLSNGDGGYLIQCWMNGQPVYYTHKLTHALAQETVMNTSPQMKAWLKTFALKLQLFFRAHAQTTAVYLTYI